MRSLSIFHICMALCSLMILVQGMPPREDMDRLLNRLQQHELAARYEEYGHNLRNLDALGGGNLLRETRPETVMYAGGRSGVFNNQKRNQPDLVPEYQPYFQPFLIPSIKRYNFDEIDHSGLVGFQKKNFDEIDHSGITGFSKKNFDEIDNAGLTGFSKKNFDEIDHSGMTGFSKKDIPHPLRLRY